MPTRNPRKAKSRKRAPLASRDKVRAHRRRLRAKGLRLITIWVPDVRSPDFIAEARRQAALLAQSPHQTDDQAFIDAISERTSD